MTTPHDAGLLHARDEAQAAHALAEGRVLITRDRDFLRWNSAGKPRGDRLLRQRYSQKQSGPSMSPIPRQCELSKDHARRKPGTDPIAPWTRLLLIKSVHPTAPRLSVGNDAVAVSVDGVKFLARGTMRAPSVSNARRTSSMVGWCNL